MAHNICLVLETWEYEGRLGNNGWLSKGFLNNLEIRCQCDQWQINGAAEAYWQISRPGTSRLQLFRHLRL